MFKFRRYWDTHPGIHYFIKWINSVLCVHTQFDILSKLYWRVIMLFQWSCPAQLHLDGCQKNQAKKRKQKTSKMWLLCIWCSVLQKCHLSPLGDEGKAKELAWFCPVRVAKPAWKFFVLTCGLRKLDTASLWFGEEGEASLVMYLLLYW